VTFVISVKEFALERLSLDGNFILGALGVHI